jgi:ankyrin repeat protein
MFAARNGNARVVQALLARGANVNSKDEGGYTALILASLDQLAVVKLLLAKSADVNATANNGVTALALASKNTSPDSAAIKAALTAAGAK